jgi:hypothetical protein
VESDGKGENIYVGREKEHNLSEDSHAPPARTDNYRAIWRVRIVISTGMRQGPRNCDL